MSRMSKMSQKVVNSQKVENFNVFFTCMLIHAVCHDARQKTKKPKKKFITKFKTNFKEIPENPRKSQKDPVFFTCMLIGRPCVP
jgi:hypothetical protein